MNRLLAASLVLCASAAFSQEIGKEIPADQQQQQQNTGTPNYDNPYATQTTPPPTPVKKDEAAAAEMGGIPGPRKMAFGIRGGFGGSTIPTAAGATAPTIGFRLLPTETVGVDFDLGMGLSSFQGNTSFGFALGLGIDAYIGHKDMPIKPFVTGGISFGKAVSTQGDDFALAFNVGGGGEYWFNDHFSVNGRALVGVPINLKSGLVTIATFTPGIGGTFYF
ncbi:MAG: hypothetical protein ACJ790_23255 [Myxococcaceae bacterium]